MKKLATFIATVAIVLSSFAQTTKIPQLVNFSAIVRDGNNLPLVNTPITLKLTFRQGGNSGTIVYCSLYQTTTNNNGFMCIEINRNVFATGCNGAPNTNFEKIPWEKGEFWMNVEYQVTPGTPFVDLGGLELASSFYAFSSGTAENIANMTVSNTGDTLYLGNKFLIIPGISVANTGTKTIPSVSTATITNITQTTAISGGNITNDGGDAVIARGVCWSTNPNPTIDDYSTYDGSDIGLFTSNPSGLTVGTPYYLRAYATNSVGTAYGSQIKFSTLDYTVGSTGPAGGFIFYDKGSYSNGWRFLEAAPFDIATGVTWGCSKTLLNNTLSGIGMGYQNTLNIINGCSESGIAALTCSIFNYNGSTGWFLPSKEELNLMYQLLKLQGIGNFSNNDYWSSTENYSTSAWWQNFGTGAQATSSNNYIESIKNWADTKTNYRAVRPARRF